MLLKKTNKNMIIGFHSFRDETFVMIRLYHQSDAEK